ncbi:hypothetical protein M902_1887 [Bacteriovorax sp. BAL6_X]|uniref:coiled-coil domain-containing protein n=1 Tax=Bacteriovorax sp. BAL6_X TaxID=1201290 RepID=UPI000385ACAE|nr:hypothetical protein [Bacteriovorax sp. BAL6_X]EPZ51847.1 hypothetical protein M902_1887 [Bacteriovorax sp. BAL6_X]
MTNRIEIYTFIEQELFGKLVELMCEDLNFIQVENITELADKKNIIVDDITYKNTNPMGKVVYISEEVKIGEVSLTPDAIYTENSFILNEIENYFGVLQTPKNRIFPQFTKVKQYKILSRFSVGYYCDLANFKAHENGFDIKNLSLSLQGVLNGIVLVRECAPVEMEMLFSDEELLISMNISSIFIDDELINEIYRFISNDFSYLCLRVNRKKGKLDLRFSLQKKKSYIARFDYEVETSRVGINSELAVNPNGKIVDHSNFHDPIVKKVTLKELKRMIDFLSKRDVTNDDFLDHLEAYSDKQMLKVLADDDIEFIKKSVLKKERAESLKEAIRLTVTNSFEDQSREEFNENFFNKIDRHTLKDLVKAENWPVDNDSLKEEIKSKILNGKGPETYNEYLNSLQGYVEENYNIPREDFETVKEGVEGSLVEEVLESSGKSVEQFIRESEYFAMKEKVARMSHLFEQMHTKLEQAKQSSSNAAPDSVEDGESPLGGMGEQRATQDLEEKVKQLSKELELKNDSIEVMSQKVDAANISAAEDKQELSLAQQKLKEEILKVEGLEKELSKFNGGASSGADSGEDIETKLKDANIEIKMYKQRLKFAQSQIQTLEKAKKAAASGGVGNKKIAHLEKLMDKQNKIKSKMETEISSLKKDNHKINQENKILSNKIKDLERKLNNKNKTAA